MTLVLVWGLPTLPELTVREARHVARLARPLGRPDGAAPGTTKRERNGQVTLAQASGARPARCSGLVLKAHPGPRPQGALPRKGPLGRWERRRGVAAALPDLLGDPGSQSVICKT